MPIFQKSIVDKYIDTLDAGVLDKAYDSYKEVYSAQKIQRIKKLKEEQYQGGFLKDIFGSVLGYTIDPEVGYNIELEKKNETNSKKADGAIVQDEKVLGVIELKSNTTKNLESIKDQAFGYKNNHKGCKYVISSNFHKLRFYVDDATEYEEFDLYNLDKETFKKFYLYLRKEGLLDKNIPKLLKEETKFHEENISKQLYKDYSAFKNKFFENIVKNNPQYDRLLLFKKSQKFLDRILFVLFAEDKELIPTNAISRIVESWALADDLHYKPLYELFTTLFEHLNVGHIYKSGYEIPAYNGGLFAPDEVLDNLKVDDEILQDDLLNLSKYDFNTDVDVNILGHIFEHSLSEIEEIEAELKGEVADKSKGKRKKDGVFYTPKYITKYIVDNTVGKLCSEKKEVLGLDTDFDIQDYQKSNGSVNSKGKELFHTLESYKEWLLSLKILDPACGSGAFLNQALTFLIEEHKNVDDLISELTNTPLRLFDTDKAILENNIFGVDINDESVEIAKLSLWLRTAQKGRKLSNLNNNIKCGDSLIDDPTVSGDKAFNWSEAFPEIFAKGGFDVVIGNPPYVDIKALDPEMVKALFKTYKTTENRINLYSIFIEKAYDLVKVNGFVSFINPNSILVNSSYKKIRTLLVDEMTKIIKLPDDVFVDAKVETIIFEFRKKNINKFVEILVYPKSEKIEFVDDSRMNRIEKSVWKNDKNLNYNIFLSIDDINLLNKIKKNSTDELGNISDFCLGITPYDKYQGHSPETIKTRAFHSKEKLDLTYKPLITGGNILRFNVTNESKEFIKYGDWLGAKRDERFFTSPRIIVRQIVSGKPPRIYAGYTEEALYFTQIGFSIIPNDGNSIIYILALLNSKLITYYHKYQYLDIEKDLFQKILIANCKQLPIKIVSAAEQQYFIEKTDIMLNLNNEFFSVSNRFQKYLSSQFTIDNLPKQLQNWHDLGFGDFIKELNKSIKKGGGEKLTKMDEMDWMDVFETKKEEAQALKSEIDKTDKEIDQMVYELYGLTKEEIQIVENS
jgi:type I restriction-modification system DNA methylase subunit